MIIRDGTFSDSVAVGIGWKGMLFITQNGGQSWLRLSSHEDFVKITLGDSSSNFLWGIKLWQRGNHSYQTQLWFFDSTYQFQLINCGLLVRDLAAAQGYGNITLVDYSDDIYRWDGVHWYQENPAAGLKNIEAISEHELWGIGGNRRVFHSVDRGYSWAEPNPQAHLDHIACG